MHCLSLSVSFHVCTLRACVADLLCSFTLVVFVDRFATFNFLNGRWPRYNDKLQNLMRSAAIGFTCSVVSDTISVSAIIVDVTFSISEALLCQNSVRVVKTVRQTYETPISYSKAIASVVEKDGVLGLFGRGLQTRLIANGMQGLMFTGTS